MFPINTVKWFIIETGCDSDQRTTETEIYFSEGCHSYTVKFLKNVCSRNVAVSILITFETLINIM